MGQSKWDELIRMEATIRKERQETLYRQRERRQKFIEIIVISLAGIIAVGFLGGLIYLGLRNRGMV
jgi:preprotein translocase subunit Sss1